MTIFRVLSLLFLSLTLLQFTSCASSVTQSSTNPLLLEATGGMLEGMWVSSGQVVYKDRDGNKVDSYLFFSFYPTTKTDENGNFDGNYEIREYRRSYNSKTKLQKATDYKLIEKGIFAFKYFDARIRLKAEFNTFKIPTSRDMIFRFDSTTRLSLFDEHLYKGTNLFLTKVTKK